MEIIKNPKNDLGFPYIAYISDEISENPALIIQLHGAGERGNGEENLEIILKNGFTQTLDESVFKDCILLMPRCEEGTFWVAKIESLKAFIDNFVDKYNVDKKRIYLCGLSMGGFGTWYTAMAYPQMFAAIAPCCGGGMAWNAGVLTMPVWAFHGVEDNVVSVNQTIEMVEALKGKNPNLRYDLYEGVRHNSWEKAFTPELMKWMLSFSK